MFEPQGWLTEFSSVASKSPAHWRRNTKPESEMSRQLASTSHSLDCLGVDGQKLRGLLACDRLLSGDDTRFRCDVGAVLADDNVGNRLIFCSRHRVSHQA